MFLIFILIGLIYLLFNPADEYIIGGTDNPNLNIHNVTSNISGAPLAKIDLTGIFNHYNPLYDEDTHDSSAKNCFVIFLKNKPTDQTDFMTKIATDLTKIKNNDIIIIYYLYVRPNSDVAYYLSSWNSKIWEIQGTLTGDTYTSSLIKAWTAPELAKVVKDEEVAVTTTATEISTTVVEVDNLSKEADNKVNETSNKLATDGKLDKTNIADIQKNLNEVITKINKASTKVSDTNVKAASIDSSKYATQSTDAIKNAKDAEDNVNKAKAKLVDSLVGAFTLAKTKIDELNKAITNNKDAVDTIKKDITANADPDAEAAKKLGDVKKHRDEVKQLSEEIKELQDFIKTYKPNIDNSKFSNKYKATEDLLSEINIIYNAANQAKEDTTSIVNDIEKQAAAKAKKQKEEEEKAAAEKAKKQKEEEEEEEAKAAAKAKKQKEEQEKKIQEDAAEKAKKQKEEEEKAAAEKAKKEEEEKAAAKAKKQKEEQEKAAAEKAKKEEEEKAAAEEKIRLEKEEADKKEKERLDKEEADKKEKERLEKKRQEAEAEKAKKQKEEEEEAEAKAKDKAAAEEKKRQEEAEKAEAEKKRQEAEAEEKKRQEAAAAAEAEKKKLEEAAKKEAEKAAAEAEKKMLEEAEKAAAKAKEEAETKKEEAKQEDANQYMITFNLSPDVIIKNELENNYDEKKMEEYSIDITSIKLDYNNIYNDIKNSQINKDIKNYKMDIYIYNIQSIKDHDNDPINNDKKYIKNAYAYFSTARENTLQTESNHHITNITKNIKKLDDFKELYKIINECHKVFTLVNQQINRIKVEKINIQSTLNTYIEIIADIYYDIIDNNHTNLSYINKVLNNYKFINIIDNHIINTELFTKYINNYKSFTRFELINDFYKIILVMQKRLFIYIKNVYDYIKKDIINILITIEIHANLNKIISISNEIEYADINNIYFDFKSKIYQYNKLYDNVFTPMNSNIVTIRQNYINVLANMELPIKAPSFSINSEKISAGLSMVLTHFLTFNNNFNMSLLNTAINSPNDVYKKSNIVLREINHLISTHIVNAKNIDIDSVNKSIVNILQHYTEYMQYRYKHPLMKNNNYTYNGTLKYLCKSIKDIQNVINANSSRFTDINQIIYYEMITNRDPIINWNNDELFNTINNYFNNKKINKIIVIKSYINQINEAYMPIINYVSTIKDLVTINNNIDILVKKYIPFYNNYYSITDKNQNENLCVELVRWIYNFNQNYIESFTKGREVFTNLSINKSSIGGLLTDGGLSSFMYLPFTLIIVAICILLIYKLGKTRMQIRKRRQYIMAPVIEDNPYYLT